MNTIHRFVLDQSCCLKHKTLKALLGQRIYHIQRLIHASSYHLISSQLALAIMSLPPGSPLTHTHTHTHTHIDTHTHTHTLSLSIYIYIYIYPSLSVRASVHPSIFLSVCLPDLPVCLSVCLSLYI